MARFEPPHLTTSPTGSTSIFTRCDVVDTISWNRFLSPVAAIGKQMVIRQTPNGAVMAISPRGSDKELTDPQRAQREKFRLAVQYAKGAKGMPEYATAAASRKLSTHNVATADFLHPPEIHDIDLSHYTGREGDVITVRAVDDVMVKTVGLMIIAENQGVIENGQMVQTPNDKTLWTFVATKNAPGTHVQVIVDAADLASQVGHETVEKDL